MQCDVLKCYYNNWDGKQERHSYYRCRKRGEKVFRAVISKQYGEIQTDGNGYPVMVCKNFKARLTESMGF